MEEKTIYKIEPFDIYTYAIRAISALLIPILICYLHINPFVFLIILLVPIGVLLFSRTSKLVITDHHLIVKHSNLIKSLSYIRRIKISEIESISFEKEFNPPGKILLPMPYALSKPNSFEIRLKDGTVFIQTQIGSENEFKCAIQYIYNLTMKEK